MILKMMVGKKRSVKPALDPSLETFQGKIDDRAQTFTVKDGGGRTGGEGGRKWGRGLKSTGAQNLAKRIFSYSLVVITAVVTL